MNAFEITVELGDVTPLSQRKLILPAGLTFEKLHEVISLVFNIDADGKYKFIFKDIGLEIRDTGRISRDIVDSRYEKIDKYACAFKSFTYENAIWNVIVRVEEKECEKVYPQIISFKGLYNPGSQIESVDEFVNLLKIKKSNDVSTSGELNNGDSLEYFYKLNIEKELLSLFNIPYEINKHSVIVIDKRNTLDNLLG